MFPTLAITFMAFILRIFNLSTPKGLVFDGVEVSDQLRDEVAGRAASEVAVIPAIRQALLARQHQFRQWPGLVADGRDMGTVVFPDAGLKVLLTASAEERAKRRYKQLIDKGIDVVYSAAGGCGAGNFAAVAESSKKIWTIVLTQLSTYLHQQRKRRTCLPQ